MILRAALVFGSICVVIAGVLGLSMLLVMCLAKLAERWEYNEADS